MFTREKIERILEKAREIDSKLEMFDTKALQKELEWWRGRFKR